MVEYEERKTCEAKIKMAFALVQLIPSLMKNGLIFGLMIETPRGFLLKLYTIKILCSVIWMFYPNQMGQNNM